MKVLHLYEFKTTLQTLDRETVREWRTYSQYVEKDVRETKEREGMLGDDVEQIIRGLKEVEGFNESNDGDEAELESSDYEIDCSSHRTRPAISSGKQDDNRL